MKVVSHAVRIAVAGGLAAGAMSIATPEADAVVTNVGNCSGHRAVVSIKSTFLWPGDGKAAGITDKNHDASFSSKGVHAVGGAPLTIGGTCTFTQTVATGALTTALSGTRSLLKWSAKSTTPVTDCIGDPDAAEWPANGKMGFSYTDLTKTDVYVATIAPTGLPLDISAFSGIVTKGVAVGAQVSGQNGAIPAIKDKTVVTDWDGTEMLTELFSGGTPAARALIQGYSIDGAALGCGAVVEPGVETANLRTVVQFGGGLSPLTLSPVTGMNFTIGAP